MPYGLFDYEDAMEPMGLSPVAPDPFNPYGYSTTNPAPSGSFDPYGFSKIPAPTPQNSGLFTRAFPENPPQQITTMAIPESSPIDPRVTRAMGEGAPLVTDAMIGSEAPQNMTLACIPSEGCNPNPVTARIPENPVTPTPPSGQCPAGYQSSNQSSNINSNPYGLTAGQQIVGSSTGKPFNVNQAGNTWMDITPRIAYASR